MNLMLPHILLYLLAINAPDRLGAQDRHLHLVKPRVRVITPGKISAPVHSRVLRLPDGARVQETFVEISAQ